MSVSEEPVMFKYRQQLLNRIQKTVHYDEREQTRFQYIQCSQGNVTSLPWNEPLI
jgi:hypothetical protein